MGTKFLAEMEGMINLSTKKLTLEINNEKVKIPIWYTQKFMNESNNYENYDESEDSEEYEENTNDVKIHMIHEMFTNDIEDDGDNDEVKEIVLG